MTKEFLGVFEPVYKGKHVSEMTDEELNEFSSWLASQINSRKAGVGDGSSAE